MSILETLASLATAKAVAAAAATTLAVGGAAGLTVANDAIADTPAEVEVPAGEGDEHRAEQADLGAGNADRDAESDVTTVEGEEVDATDDAENEGRAAEVHASLTAEGYLTPEDGEAFGRAVADNARDGEPGAFGRSVADAARNGAGEDRGGESEAADQREEAQERRPEGTPAADERRPEGTPAEGEGSESRVDGEETAESNQGADRPGSAGAAGRP
jgi:hypothetical protein